MNLGCKADAPLTNNSGFLYLKVISKPPLAWVATANLEIFKSTKQKHVIS